jgi:ATPase subunit of ABC transporter with duplicated ATPase domains
VLVAANITMQFGAKPLFENVNVKFGEGYRYGLIGANGAGKSTFMKILCGALEPSAGNVSKEKHERMAYLRQDQFAYEDMRVLDVVLMGHEEMWACMQRTRCDLRQSGGDRRRLHARRRARANLPSTTATPQNPAPANCCSASAFPTEQHNGPMREVAPGWKLRVLLCQALFANPDILLLDEPTNNLDINTIRWLEDVLNNRDSTMIIISHDRHFLNQVCTHMADLDYGKITIYPGNYDDFMEASHAGPRAPVRNANAKAKERIAELQTFVRRFSANASKAKQATSRMKLIDKLKPEDVKPSSRQYPWIRFDYDEKDKLHRQAVEVENILRLRRRSARYSTTSASRSMPASGSPSSVKTASARPPCSSSADGRSPAAIRQIKWAEKAKPGYYSQDHSALFQSEPV